MLLPLRPRSAFTRIHAELALDVSTRASTSLSAITNAAVTPRAQLITRTRPLEDIAASSEEMLTLFTLARELTGRMSVADIGDVLLKHLRRLVPSSLCVFYLYDTDTTDLVASHVSGENGEAIHGLRIPLGERLSGWVGANRQSIRNSDPVLDFGDVARSMKPRLGSCLSTPLISGETLVGVLSLYAKGADAFTEDHQRLVEIVGRQVSAVLQRSVEYATSSLRAFRDPLTGLPNIEHLRQLANEHNHLSELPTPTALIYIDVNELKKINLAYGRNVGDQTLHEVVRHLRENLRAADVLFRLESDDFAVLLLQTDKETANAIAARMKLSVRQVNSIATSKLTINLSVSVAVAPEDGNRIDSLVEKARRNLTVRGNGLPSPESIH